MLAYKAKLVGIVVIVREESYTSQASFLDGDEFPTYDPNRNSWLLQYLAQSISQRIR
jgi:putative transposase